MQKLEDTINIVGQINEHPILPLSKPARYFIIKRNKLENLKLKLDTKIWI